MTGRRLHGRTRRHLSAPGAHGWYWLVVASGKPAPAPNGFVNKWNPVPVVALRWLRQPLLMHGMSWLKVNPVSLRLVRHGTVHSTNRRSAVLPGLVARLRRRTAQTNRIDYAALSTMARGVTRLRRGAFLKPLTC